MTDVLQRTEEVALTNEAARGLGLKGSNAEPKHIRIMRAIGRLSHVSQTLVDLKIEVAGAPVIKAPEDRQPPEKRRQLVPLAQFFIEAHEQIVQIADLIEKNVTELRSALYE